MSNTKTTITEAIKKDFPLLQTTYNGREVVYLDNAATTQKPQQVLDAILHYYKSDNANVSRSSHFLGERATLAYDNARNEVAKFINSQPENIVFTKNSTEAMNMVALGWGRHKLTPEDVVVTTFLEHNSSLLPWVSVAKEKGAQMRYLQTDLSGKMLNWKQLLDERVKVLIITHVSNVLGVVLPIAEIIKEAKKYGIVTIVDGSQAVPYQRVDVKSLGCDFYIFSGHKMLGPTGIGVLYGKEEVLQDMHPLYLGGGTVKTTEIENLKEIPHRFEAGTPNIEGAVGLSAAIDYINLLGIDDIHAHVKNVTEYAYQQLSKVPGLHIVGPSPEDMDSRSGLISFYIDGVHSHDLAAILSEEAIAVRAGLHCSMKLFETAQLPSVTRASFYLYNFKSDVDLLLEGVEKGVKLLKS